MNIISFIWRYAEAEKEFLVSLSILVVLVAIFYVLAKAYLNFKVKQEQCDGRFKHLESRQDISDKKAEAAEKSVQNMEPKVDDMHDWFKKLIEGKWEHNAKEETS